MPESKITIKGCIPHTFFPSAGYLAVEMDATGRNTDEARQKLEEELRRIDDKYARERAKLQGRGVQADYWLVGGSTTDSPKSKRPKKSVEHSVVSFTPYPSVYTSKLASLRGKMYGSAAKPGLYGRHNAIVLEREQHGRQIRTTYFMLEQEAAAVMHEIEDLNKDLTKLNEEISAYEQTRDFHHMLNMMEDFVPHEKWSRAKADGDLHSEFPAIRIDLTPFPLNEAIINMYSEPKVMEGVRRGVTQAVEQVCNNFQSKLSNWISLLAEKLGSETGPLVTTEDGSFYTLSQDDKNLLNGNLESIKAMTKEYQVEHLLDGPLKMCADLVSATTSNNPVQINEVAMKIGEYAGVDLGDKSPGAILHDAALKMQKVDEETRAFIRTLF